MSDPPDLTPRVSLGFSPRSSADLGPNPEPRRGLSSQPSVPLAAASAASSDLRVRRESASASSPAPSGTLGFSPARPSADLGFSPEPRLGLRPSLPSSAAAASSAAPSSAPQPAPSTAQGITEEESRAIAREIGGFFARALAGQFRGQSGRNRNPLKTRLYVVVRGASGEEFRPPILCQTLSEVRGYCEEDGQLRDSIFCGFPAAWEAKLACEAAGLPLPAYRSNVRGQ